MVGEITSAQASVRLKRHVFTVVFLWVVFALGITALASLSEAREARSKDVPLDLKPGDKLQIIGVKGSVKLLPLKTTTANASGKNAKGAASTLTAVTDSGGILRVRKAVSDKASPKTTEAFEQWLYSVRREENTVIVEAKGPDAKADWESQLKPGYPELHFDIEAPSVPVEIGLREGVVQVGNWKAGITVHVVDGQVKAVKNEGSLRVIAQKGEVRVEGHKGRVEVDGFNPKTVLTGIDGDLVLDNFAGESSVSDLRGSLQLKAFSGATIAAKIDGGVDFDLGRATLNLSGLEGSLRGQLDNGSVSAKIQGDPEVNIESRAGGVSLTVSGGGASARVQTEDGNLNVPGTFATSNSSSQKIATGRVGTGGKGSIYVRTKTGNVRLL